MNAFASIGIFSQFLYRLFVDLTAVCMIEGFNNPNWLVQADRVLKEIGKEKAQEYYKVWIKLYEFGELISAIERMTKSSSFV